MSNALVAQLESVGKGPLQELRRDCDQLAQISPGDIQRVSSLLQKMSLRYYEDVRRQAQQSFYCALGAAFVGTLFFIYAASITMRTGEVSNANISLIAGGLIEVISGINFWLYGRAAKQFTSFHSCLERTNRFLLANSLCEQLDGAARKDEVRVEIIRVVANAPMLTLDVLGAGTEPVKATGPAEEKLQ